MIDDFEKVMKAAGDPVRARILKLLEGREISVGQMMDVLRLSQSTVSGHLSQLKAAGLVKDRRDGRRVYYSFVVTKDNSYALPVLALLMGWLDDDPAVRADRRRLATIAGGDIGLPG